MSLFNSNAVSLSHLRLIAYLLAFAIHYAKSTARTFFFGRSATEWVSVYLYIGITLSDYKVPQDYALFKME